MVRTCFWPLNHQKQNKTKQNSPLPCLRVCAPAAFRLHPYTCLHLWVNTVLSEWTLPGPALTASLPAVLSQESRWQTKSCRLGRHVCGTRRRNNENLWRHAPRGPCSPACAFQQGPCISLPPEWKRQSFFFFKDAIILTQLKCHVL